MAIIFDLDQTLIDSRTAEKYRKARQWSSVYRMIPQFKPYEGIDELFTWLHTTHIPIVIVTSSPKPYYQRVVACFQWRVDYEVCYHDTLQHKPHPEPILKALKILNCVPSEVVSVGDHAKDILASRQAGVFSVAGLWGTENRHSLLSARPDHACQTVNELHTFLTERFS